MCSERKRTQCPTLDFPNPYFFSCPPFLMPFFLPTFLSTTFSLFYAIFPISWKSFFRFSTAIFLPPFFRCPFSAHPFFDVFSPFPHFNAIFLPHFFRRNFFFKAMQSWCVRQSFFSHFVSLLTIFFPSHFYLPHNLLYLGQFLHKKIAQGQSG